MIYLEKNSTTEWYTPSNQLQTIENPYYLMQIRSQDTKEYFYSSLTNSSTDSNFAIFSITEGLDFVIDEGMYDYVLYESDYDSLNTASASNILNIGLMRVVGTEWTFSEPVYDDLNDTITYRYTD